MTSPRLCVIQGIRAVDGDVVADVRIEGSADIADGDRIRRRGGVLVRLGTIIDLCDMLQRLRLSLDAIVAIEEYRADQDVVGEFLKDCCQLTGEMVNEFTGRPYETPVRRLRERFLAWCKEEGNDTPLSPRSFGEKLIARGLCRRKSHGVMIYVGVHVPEPRGDVL